MYLELDNLERCAFLHGVQHVAINTLEVFLDIAKFLAIFAIFHENFWSKKLSSL